MTRTTTQIAHRYELVARLGSGGMSTVELAFDSRLERYVAVKLLAAHLAEDHSHVLRFHHEALAAASLVHPNIVQVFDCGFDEEAGRPFIVMEHVSGKSCAQLLRTRERATIGEAVRIIMQACHGLHHAHLLGVVHRDVKSANLLVSDSGAVKLTDFGIARVQGREHLTEAGLVLGTVSYVSPEQARGQNVGPRSDVYGLGVVAYELLTGRLPFAANTLPELILEHRQAPIAPSAINALVPVPLADAVMAALAPDPRGRPADAIAFGTALCAGIGRSASPPKRPAKALATQELPTRRLASSEDLTAAVQTMIGPPASGRLRRAARQAFVVAALAVVLASLIVALGYAQTPFVVHALTAISRYGHQTVAQLTTWAGHLRM